VALIGLMGAGKSTIGRRLARELAMPFIDSDQLIVAAAKRSIGEIFAEEGEAGFRVREFAVLRDALCGSPAVVAVGGGAVTHPPTRELIATAAVRVYVHVEPRAAVARLRRTRTVRPLVGRRPTVERVRSLLEQREALYREAEITVSGTGGLESVTREIVERLRTFASFQPGVAQQ
jgi:shikimate kinase